MSTSTVSAQAAIVGGGPAGVMLGFLLARAGVRVVVLEKHVDFFRDFRGDTIHPSTLQVIHELGLLEEFLKVPHQEVREVTAHFGSQVVRLADFTHLPVKCPFIAFMPQWDFLDFLTAKARRYPGFDLRMGAEVKGLISEHGRIAGLTAQTAAGELEVRADLVIGADGRDSTVRRESGLKVEDYGAPIDVLWFRISKQASDPEQSFGFVGAGQFMVLIARGEYWQCAYVIRKGSLPERKERGLDAFRAELAGFVTFLGNRTHEIESWDHVKLLTVKVDHLPEWHREGLLCIGDSAHAMSPIGGVGINLAIQDAVATANLLAAKLREGTVTRDDLRAVQARRARPTWLTQRAQIFMHEHFLEPLFSAKEQPRPPLAMRLAERLPLLRRIPARMIGLGVRPEHVQTPEWAPPH